MLVSVTRSLCFRTEPIRSDALFRRRARRRRRQLLELISSLGCSAGARSRFAPPTLVSRAAPPAAHRPPRHAPLPHRCLSPARPPAFTYTLHLSFGARVFPIPFHLVSFPFLPIRGSYSLSLCSVRAVCTVLCVDSNPYALVYSVQCISDRIDSDRMGSQRCNRGGARNISARHRHSIRIGTQLWPLISICDPIQSNPNRLRRAFLSSALLYSPLCRFPLLFSRRRWGSGTAAARHPLALARGRAGRAADFISFDLISFRERN